MTTIAELNEKIDQANRLMNQGLYVTNVYRRSSYPYTLGMESNGVNATLARGTKDDLYNYVDALMSGYNTALSNHNIKRG